MNRSSQLQKVFDKIKTFDGIGLVSVLKECRDVNGLIHDKTALMTVANYNWNRNDKNCMSKVKYIVKVLIQHGANVNFQNGTRSGATVLHFVVSGLKEVIDVEIVQLLLDYGADPNKVDCFGRPPIFYCKNKWMERVLQMFQNHGANFRKKDNEGNTLLHAHRWSPLTYRELMKFDVDVNAQNNDGETPTLRQIWCCYRIFDSVEDSAIKLLIQHNANVNTKDMHGITPLFVACGMENKDHSVKLAKILLEAGARVNVQVSCKGAKHFFPNFVDFLDGETALHIAIRLKNLPLVQLLVDFHHDWLRSTSYYDNIQGFSLFILSENDYDHILCCIDKKIQHQRQQSFSYLHKSWIRQTHHEQKSSTSLEKRNIDLIASILIPVLFAFFIRLFWFYE